MFALRLILLLVIGGSLAAFQNDEPASTDINSVGPVERAQPTALSDTLMYTVRAGQPLLLALPPRRNGEEVSYRLIEGPALSWLVDRSFLWTTTPQERGTLPVLLERRAAGMVPDTLVLLIEITS